jgi:hypothetical protein
VKTDSRGSADFYSLLTPHSSLVLLAAALFFLKFGWWLFPTVEHPDLFAHLPWTQRWHDPGLFPNDLMSDYFETYHLTPGVRAAYFVLYGVAGVGLTATAKIVSAGCFIAAFVLLVAVVRQAGGPWWATVAAVAAAGGAVAAAQVVWPPASGIDPFYWLDSGLSRAPAAAVLLLLLYGLARPSAVAVNLSLLLGALTYPPAFVLAFTAAVLAALVRGSPRVAVRSLVSLVPGAAAAGLVVLVWYPLGVDPRFGPLVTRADIAWAPEIVPHHFPHGTRFLEATLLPWIRWNTPALVALYVQGRLTKFDRLTRAGVILLAAGLVTTFVSDIVWLRLYDIDRYITWPQRVVLVTSLAAVVVRVFSPFPEVPTVGRFGGRVAAVVVAVSALGLVAAEVSRLARFPVPVQMPPPITRYLAGLPVDAVIAAYPGDGDDVPLRTRRTLLVHPVALFPYHRDFYRESRARFLATQDAVYATDWQAVRRLRDEYGVGYLLVNRGRYTPERYAALAAGHVCLADMTAYTKPLLDLGPDRPFVLRDPPAGAVVARDGEWMVIDLGRLP